MAFLKDTQPEEYKKLVDAKGGSESEAEKALFSRLDTELTRYGTLSVLKDRNGLSAPGANFKMMYTKPVSSKNAEHEGLYHLNRVSIMRQFKYSKNVHDILAEFVERNFDKMIADRKTNGLYPLVLRDIIEKYS